MKPSRNGLQSAIEDPLIHPMLSGALNHRTEPDRRPDVRSHAIKIESLLRRASHQACDAALPYHALPASPVNTANLYLLLARRPPPRAFAQIPYSRLSWSLNNNAAGRGASHRRLLGRAFTAASHIQSQGSEEGEVLRDGRLSLPPRSPAVTDPFAVLPSRIEESLPAGRHPRSEPSFAQEPPSDTDPFAVLNSGNKESSSPATPPRSQPSLAQESAATDPFAILYSGNNMVVERETPEELHRIRSKVALWNSEESQAPPSEPIALETLLYKPSDQVHVMGLDLRGRYIAHALAGCRTIPPVRYILHNNYMSRRWHELNKQLTLFRGHDMITRRRVKADYAVHQDASLNGGLIDNLLVTLPPSQVLQAIGQIRHRLDHRSSICLVNDGLGVAEALIETYFPDESKRPVFILGHFTTSLDHADHLFSVSEVRPGRLYLSLFSGPGGNHDVPVKRHPPPERTIRATHFIRLLTAMPGLNATGHPIADFMRYKLPTVAFRTVVDPLAALFECRYDGLVQNSYARQLMDILLGELSGVLSRLPECRNSPKFRQLAVFSELRRQVVGKMLAQRTADSKMRSQVARGWDTDVDFLSGYFVKRGRQLHCRVDVLDSVMWAVKGKQTVELKKLAGEIPLQKETEPAEAPGSVVEVGKHTPRSESIVCN